MFDATDNLKISESRKQFLISCHETLHNSGSITTGSVHLDSKQLLLVMQELFTKRPLEAVSTSDNEEKLLLITVLQDLASCLTYIDFFQNEHFKSVVVLLNDANEVLAYSAVRLVVVCFKKSVIDVKLWTSSLLKTFTATECSDIYRINVLLILQKCFHGTDSTGELRTKISAVLGDSWSQLLRSIFQTDPNPQNLPNVSCIVLHDFLALWTKLVKFHFSSEDNIHTNVRKPFDLLAENGSQLNLLLDVILRWNAHARCDCCLQRSLNVLCAHLQYGSHLALLPRSSSIGGQFGKLSTDIVERLPVELIQFALRNFVDSDFVGNTVTPAGTNMQSYPSTTSFATQSTSTTASAHIDAKVLKKLTLLLFKCCASLSRFSMGDGVPHALSVVKQIDEAACASRLCTDMGLSWPIVLFSEHDGHLTEALLTLLDLHVCVGTEESLPAHLQPVILFIRFAASISWDCSVLLDLLTSPETCFLLYFTRLLRFLINSWPRWLDTDASFVTGDIGNDRNLSASSRQSNNGTKAVPSQSLVQYELSSSDDESTDTSVTTATNLPTNDSASDASESSVLQMMTVIIELQVTLERLDRRNVTPFNCAALLLLLQRLRELWISR